MAVSSSGPAALWDEILEYQICQLAQTHSHDQRDHFLDLIWQYGCVLFTKLGREVWRWNLFFAQTEWGCRWEEQRSSVCQMWGSCVDVYVGARGEDHWNYGFIYLVCPSRGGSRGEITSSSKGKDKDTSALRGYKEEMEGGCSICGRLGWAERPSSPGTANYFTLLNYRMLWISATEIGYTTVDYSCSFM